MPYKVAFAETVTEHLRWLTAAERSRVLDAIERQLVREPPVETRNRKPLRPNPLARGSCASALFGFFYEVAVQEAGTVRVLAVGK